MFAENKLSTRTRNNWLVDVGLFTSAVIAALSGIYFLFLPVGGYQGGRNPWYGVTILFSRKTWDDLHTWGGIAMIAIVVIHLSLHWSWVVNMLKRVVKELLGQCGCMNWRGRFNLVINVIVAFSFLLVAISGVYLLFVPAGRNAVDLIVLFNRTTWDLIHTWAGVVLISAAIIHFAIHWRWVTKVTKEMTRPFTRAFNSQPRDGEVDQEYKVREFGVN